ncbi:MAG: hypothetical protein R3E12_18770 [Candidatus Eisenbacteria bacterium]
MAALGLLAWFVRRNWATKPAIYATALGAVSTFDLHYAQDARMYALLALLWLGSFVCMIETMRGSRRAATLWTVLAAALAWTHLYGVVVSGAEVVTLALFERRASAAIRQRIRGPVRAGMLVVVASIAAVAVLFHDPPTFRPAAPGRRASAIWAGCWR